jgi:F-type H+-transporting ATPase subunit epsilon
MSSALLQVICLTPAQKVAELEALSVTIPGEAGQFGVLPGHMALVSTLQPGGTVEVNLPTGLTERFTVRGGVAQITPHSVTILAEALEGSAGIR